MLNVKPVFQTLLKLNSTWSQRLLRECFQPKALCLLALVAEFAGAALRFTRKLDSGSLPAAAIGRAVQALEAELRDLFDFKDCRGHPQEPLVLSSKFQMGYIQILCREHLGLELAELACLLFNVIVFPHLPGEGC